MLKRSIVPALRRTIRIGQPVLLLYIAEYKTTDTHTHEQKKNTQHIIYDLYYGTIPNTALRTALSASFKRLSAFLALSAHTHQHHICYMYILCVYIGSRKRAYRRACASVRATRISYIRPERARGCGGTGSTYSSIEFRGPVAHSAAASSRRPNAKHVRGPPEARLVHCALVSLFLSHALSRSRRE